MSAATKVFQKCQECGGELIFNPSKNGLVCKNCGNFVSVTGTISAEKSFQTLLEKAPTWKKETAVLQCEHCGAKCVVSKFDIMAKCDYCGSSNLIKTTEVPGLRPDTVVVFDMNRADALTQVNTWLSKRFFVPSQFKQQLKNRQINGVYFPAFTFDANVTAKYTGVLVQTSTTTIVVNENETTQSQIVRRGINDIISRTFDDCLVLANDEITPQVLAKLQPYDTNRGQTFQQSYLSGFNVCQPSKEAQKCWSEAKNLMESTIRRQITTRYATNNTHIEDIHLDLNITNITYKYVLLPVYVGHIEYKGTKYPLYVNGQTGKIYGKTPKSWWKILLTFGALGIAAFAAGIFLAMFL